MSKRKGKIETLITHASVLLHQDRYEDYDMTASDAQYIRNHYNQDYLDVMYATYKLGFARAMKMHERESQKKES